jgi:hypothetical protein
MSVYQDGGHFIGQFNNSAWVKDRRTSWKNPIADANISELCSVPVWLWLEQQRKLFPGVGKEEEEKSFKVP